MFFTCARTSLGGGIFLGERVTSVVLELGWRVKVILLLYDAHLRKRRRGICLSYSSNISITLINGVKPRAIVFSASKKVFWCNFVNLLVHKLKRTYRDDPFFLKGRERWVGSFVVVFCFVFLSFFVVVNLVCLFFGGFFCMATFLIFRFKSLFYPVFEESYLLYMLNNLS